MVRYTSIFLLLTGSALLTGCAAGPDFAAPVLEAPTGWSDTGQPATQPPITNTPAKEWWMALEDDTLNRLMEAAYKDNPSLNAAEARIAQADANRRSLRSSLFPEIQATGSLNRADNGSFGGVGQSGFAASGLNTTRSVGADFSMGLDPFGRVWRALEGANALRDAQNAEAASTRLTLETAVAEGWFMRKACGENARHLREDQDALAILSQAVGKRMEAGFATRADKALADANSADGAAALTAQQSACEQADHSLMALTGMDKTSLESLLSAEAAMAGLAAPPGYTLGIPAETLAERPDIQAALKKLEAANAEIGVAIGKRYPSINLSGALAHQWIGGTPALSFDTWSIGPSISLPIFMGGAITAGIDAKQAAYDEALAALRETVRQAAREVEDALSRIRAAESRAISLADAVTGYEHRLTDTDALYKTGGASLLDREAIRRSLLQARRNLTDTQSERLLAWIALMRATGGKSAVALPPPAEMQPSAPKDDPQKEML